MEKHLVTAPMNRKITVRALLFRAEKKSQFQEDFSWASKIGRV
jgi:hypothetical protein